MRLKYYTCILTLLVLAFPGCTVVIEKTHRPDTTQPIVTVDLLAGLGLNHNALAPQVVKVDSTRNRVFVACANSSAVAVIEGASGTPPSASDSKSADRSLRNDNVFTIPVGSRMPRRLRDAGMKVAFGTGELYLLGEKQLIIVDPDQRTSRAIPLPSDFEAIDLLYPYEWAFLAGRTSADLAAVNLKTEEVKLIPIMEPAPPLPFMAASAPPPIRFPFVDPIRNRVYVVDGIHAELITVDSKTLKKISSRKLPVEPVPRWHTAGSFMPETGMIYTVLENKNREAICALAIDAVDGNDQKADLPARYREPAGVNGDPVRQEVYIPSDNHPVVQVVTFGDEPKVEEIEVTDVGVDSTAYDGDARTLYAAGWKQAVLYVLDIETRKNRLTVPFFPVYPHMNNMALNSRTGKLYVPTGSTAVNGAFGAAVTVFDTRTLDFSEIQTGWAPVCLAKAPGSDSFFVFSANKEFARVSPDGSYTLHTLPHSYARQALAEPNEPAIWVAYGPHSSWWPNYYIHGTRTGLFKIDCQGNVLLNRSTPKLAQGMLFDSEGSLWIFQNTWGKEEPFLIAYPNNSARSSAEGKNPRNEWTDLRLPPKVENECLLRLLALDEKTGLIYAGRTGNRNTENGLVYAVNPGSLAIEATYEVGRTPTAISILPEAGRVFVANFDDDTVSIIDTKDGSIQNAACGKKPLAAAADKGTGRVYVVNHLGESLTVLDRGDKQEIPLPSDALPDNLLVDPKSGHVYITAHSEKEARIYRVDSSTGAVKTLLEAPHSYGEVTFDQANAAFQERGQWGDGIFRITDMALDDKGRLWVSDYLGGKVWIINRH